MKYNTSLTVLKLNVSNSMKSKNFLIQLSNALKVNSTLTTLDIIYIKNNNLNPLDDALKVNSTLKNLYLQISHIKNINSLTDALKVNSSLEVLSLVNCDLRDKQKYNDYDDDK